MAAVLILEVVVVELEKASPIVGRWGALEFAVLFVGLGFVLRRYVPTRPALFGVLAGAIAYVTLEYWVLGYVGNGTTAWAWLGPPTTVAIATVYFFTLMAIGVGAASLRLPRKTQ